MVGTLVGVLAGVFTTLEALGLEWDLDAKTLSNLRMKVKISSGVIPMAAAAVKYGVSVLSQCEPQAGKIIQNIQYAEWIDFT